MKPKEKAKDLINKYEKKLMYDYNDYTYKYNLEHCKQCALIAVDELINNSMPSCEFGGYIQSYTVEYWEEVKQEIIKL